MDTSNFDYLPKEKIFFISLEGIEGCGKSTQIEMLESYLGSLNNYKTHCFREPGGTEFGEKLRDAMLGSTKKISALSEAHLFASSRCQLLTERVLPLLNTEKNIVIYDRYLHSSIAYQGYGSGLGQEAIYNIHSTYPLKIIPHLTIYLEIDIKTSQVRQDIRNNAKDYFESQKEEFYSKVIDGYNFCKKEFESFISIDGNMPKNIIFEEIKNLIREKIDEN